MKNKIKKAVIPIAGKGTRFLPATKEVPKELIPILTVPMIHYVVQEAVNAGIEQIIFITSSGKHAVENYFDRNQELEAFLEKNNKLVELELIRKIGSQVEVISVRQKEQLGLGHAVLCAEKIIGNESFAVLLGDDIVINQENPATAQLMRVSEEHAGASVIGVMSVPREDTAKYGIVYGDSINKKTLLMKGMVEKPKPDVAPTLLATPGRYILKPEIFNLLKTIPRGAGNEYQLTDAINLLAQNEKVYAHEFDGERFDTGNIFGYLDATIDFALNDSNMSTFMKDLLLKKIQKFGIKI